MVDCFDEGGAEFRGRWNGVRGEELEGEGLEEVKEALGVGVVELLLLSGGET